MFEVNVTSNRKIQWLITRGVADVYIGMKSSSCYGGVEEQLNKRINSYSAVDRDPRSYAHDLK